MDKVRKSYVIVMTMSAQTERQKLRQEAALAMIKKTREKGSGYLKFDETFTPSMAVGQLWNGWRYLSSEIGADSVMFKISPETNQKLTQDYKLWLSAQRHSSPRYVRLLPF